MEIDWERYSEMTEKERAEIRRAILEEAKRVTAELNRSMAYAADAMRKFAAAYENLPPTE